MGSGVFVGYRVLLLGWLCVAVTGDLLGRGYLDVGMGVAAMLGDVYGIGSACWSSGFDGACGWWCAVVGGCDGLGV